MTLGRKLLASHAPLAAAVVLLAILLEREIGAMADQAFYILRGNYHHARSVHRMELELGVLHARAIAGDGAGDGARFEAELAIHERDPVMPDEPERAARVRRAWEAYERVRRELAVGADVDRESRASRTARELGPLYDATVAACEDLFSLHDASMRGAYDEEVELARRLRALGLGASALLLTVGLVVSSRLSRRIREPIGALARAAERVAEKDFDAAVATLEKSAPSSSGDEIAALARSFGTMTEELRRFEALSVDELLRTRQSLKAAIDSLSDPVLVLSPAREIVTANRAATTLLSLEEGGTLAPLDASPKLRAHVEEVASALLSGSRASLPTAFDAAAPLDSPRGPVWLLARGATIDDGEGRVLGVSVMLQDVTRWRRFDELKSDMVSTVAHELRTPLTSLRMALGLLEDGTAGPVTAKQRDLLAGAREDCERLRGMVEDILDLGRLQAGRLVLRRSRVDVGTFVRETLAAFEAVAATRGAAIEVVIDDAAGTAEFDPERVRLVLANFVTNAIKYGPDGGRVVVRASASAADVRVAVEDQGAGIPEESRAHLFDKFYRVPGSPPGGAGLGLWIAREIVVAHGGEVGVTSAPGEGCTFWFRLPRTVEKA